MTLLRFQYDRKERRFVFTDEILERLENESGVKRSVRTQWLTGKRHSNAVNIGEDTSLPGSDKTEKVPPQRIFMSEVDVSRY